MDAVAALPSKEIHEIILPTFKIFSPLLQRNSPSITAIPKATHAYGPHPRQNLDIYTPPAGPSPTQPAPPPPLLIFLYGGALVGGDRTLPPLAVPDQLVYANLGAFFAARGFVTLIPDYRRVNDPEAGSGEDAVFPSGALDLGAVLEWLVRGGADAGAGVLVPGAPARDVFVLGNSAGGIHLATWLLAPQFADARRGYLSGAAGGEMRLRLRGAVLFAVPFHFKSAAPERSSVLASYYGPEAEGKCPFGLLQALQASKPADAGIPPLLNLEGELDPEEILEPGRDFVALWREVFGGGEHAGMEEWWLKGHNHISPPVALMSGDRQGEKWGEDLVGWMRGVMSRGDD